MEPPVRYHESEAFPGVQLFRCARLLAELTPTACAKNHAHARSYQCTTCAIGAYHSAGKDVGPAPVAFDGRVATGWRPGLDCVRCGRRGMRLIRGSTLCVSCYNRELEVLRGTNAKGATPKKWAVLRAATATIVGKGKREVVRLPLVSGRDEAERLVARRWPGYELVKLALDQDLPAARRLQRDATRTQASPF